MIRAVAWDIDGTLIDSEPTHHAALMQVSARYGAPVAEDDPRFLGIAMEDVFDVLAPHYPAGLAVETWLDEIVAVYVASAAQLPPLRGAREAVQALRAGRRAAGLRLQLGAPDRRRQSRRAGARRRVRVRDRPRRRRARQARSRALRAGLPPLGRRAVGGCLRSRTAMSARLPRARRGCGCCASIPAVRFSSRWSSLRRPDRRRPPGTADVLSALALGAAKSARDARGPRGRAYLSRTLSCHPGESGDPGATRRALQRFGHTTCGGPWIPAFAGMITKVST